MKNIGENMNWEELRNKAIQVMNLKTMNSDKPQSEDTMKLMQDLELYRIELELENRKLKCMNELTEKSKKEYVQLFENAPTANFVLSREGNIKKVNQSGSVLLGHEKTSLVGTAFTRYISEDSKEIFNHFLYVLYDKKIRQTVDVSLSINNRKSREIEISGIILPDSEDFIVILRDITRRKKTEQHLVHSKEKAENADRLKTSFLSAMSHEIRAPLNSIIGFSGILMQEIPGTLNEEQKKQLGMIQSSGRHLLTLINDLLDLSKIEAGQLSVNFEYFNLKDVLDDVIQLEWPLAKEKNLELNLNSGNDPVLIKSDKQRIHQVLLNLINNAIKYSEKGHIDVNCFKEDDTITVEIKDTGIGIKKEDLQKIFDPFIQLENELTKTQKGSGLGLSVSRQLIRLLQGTLNVESSFGEGTKFTIKIPSVVK
jgi:PAS domain S-box-containing protein